MFKMFVGLAAGLAVACTSPVQASEPELSISKIHTIGVSSNLGDQAEVEYVGAMVFGNHLTYLSVADWKLNELAASEVKKELGDHFSVLLTPIDEGNFGQMRKGFFGSQEKSLEAVVQKSPPANVDAYLILLPATESLPYPSNQAISGLGVYRQWPGIQGPDPDHHFGEAIIHLTYSIFLVNAKTGRTISASVGKPSIVEKQSLMDNLLLLPRPLRSPHAYTGDATWPKTADVLTDQQKQTMRDDLVRLIKDSIPHTLAEMGLVVPAAAMADPNDEVRPAAQ